MHRPRATRFLEADLALGDRGLEARVVVLAGGEPLLDRGQTTQNARDEALGGAVS